MRTSSSRLKKKYRIMWNEDGGTLSFYNPPMTPDQVAKAHFGLLEGTPVDAYLCALGNCTGYTTAYPTNVQGMEFVVDRYKAGYKVGPVHLWRYAENVRRLWEGGHDLLELQRREAKRLGMDFWFHLRMNDWHHTGAKGKDANILAGRFYVEHPEFLIGEDAVKGLHQSLQALAGFQDYAHPEVRQLRLDVVAEAAERYDIDGFQYDFMRCHGYFKPGQEKANMPVMTRFIRETREILDRIGAQKNKPLGFSVRVPNTIWGANNLGFDVETWIKEELVDIVVPSTFFNADLEEDIREWVDLARGTSVRINPAIEEGYFAGHTGGVLRCFYNPPNMLPLTLDMINAIAARHWRNGADGLYVFNWFGTKATYDYDLHPALNNIDDPQKLKFKNKRYVVMRRDESTVNCLPIERQLPVKIGIRPLTIHLVVTDDLSETKARLKLAQIHVHFANLTVADQIEVRLNGKTTPCATPIIPGTYGPFGWLWQTYDLADNLPRCGDNEITFHLHARPQELEKEIPLEITDLELALEYQEG
jgi:hypothetical protein